VAVKFSTAKLKCRSHFDRATQCCCVPLNITQSWHFTALMIWHHFGHSFIFWLLCSSWHSLLNSSLWNKHASPYIKSMPSVCHCHSTILSVTLPFCHSQHPFLNNIHQLFMRLLLDCLTLMMKAQWSSDTLGSVYSVTQHNIPEDLSLQHHHYGDPKLTKSIQVKLWE